MNSTFESPDGWPREDELDLDHEDEVQDPSGLDDAGLPTGDDLVEYNELQPPDSPTERVSTQGRYASADDGTSPLYQESTAAGPGLGSSGETASTPDDTPSQHGSILSSQGSSALALRGSPLTSPSPSHRPFDLRFQSRLSFPGVLRSSSPYLSHMHSRQSSLASHLSPSTANSEAEPPQDPWDVVRWTRLRKISSQAFSEVGKRNFGQPTCLAVSTTIVIGTSKGIILVFDYEQNLKAIIGLNTKAIQCGAITSLAISADHSTVAGGHALGDIFTWEIIRPARPFLHIPPIRANQVGTRSFSGHILGFPAIHLGFLGTRRTALVSADNRGMAFSHLATRGMGAVGRTVKTARILGRYPQLIPEGKARKPSSVLSFSPLPLGNIEQASDPLGLVAMLTPYLLVIVSTTPVARTQYKTPRPREVHAHGAMTGTLAWFPAIKLKGRDAETSRTKLAYCWSNVLTVLEVFETEPGDTPSKDEPPSLTFRSKNRWKADEAIVSVQWLSRSVLAALTITQQLLIIEDKSMHVTDTIDLINRHIYHTDLFSSQLHSLIEQSSEEDSSMHWVVADAFYMSFRSYKGRLFLLGHNDVTVGSLSNWADRLIALMEAGNFIEAIRLATSYYKGSGEMLTIGLPNEDALRQSIVREKLLEMVSASLKYAFGRNVDASNKRLDDRLLRELGEVSIDACVCTADDEFLWEEVFSWYDEHKSLGIFLDALEPYIINESVRSLPPLAVKALINHFTTNHTSDRLEEIICLLDTTTMDIDQVTTLCKRHNLYDAYIYVWNRCLGDYVGPLQELLALIPTRTEWLTNGESAKELKQYINARKMFPYLSYILTSRVYPTGEYMDDEESIRAKTALYGFLFSGSLPGTDAGGRPEATDSFPILQAVLDFDTPSFMSMLNEAFEDSFLNQEHGGQDAESVTINRQYLLTILLQVMNDENFSSFDAIYLDMFIARNLPKYPQYILLSGSTLHQVAERLCRYPNPEMAEDCELSVEYLLSIYHPPDIRSMVPFFKEAGFFRILKSVYRSERQFPQLISAYLDDHRGQELVFVALEDCLRPGSGLGKKQRLEVIDVVKDCAGRLAAIDVQRAAQVMNDFAPEIHETFLRVLDADRYKQYQYLAVAVGAHIDSRQAAPAENWMIERYVQLLCKYDPSRVADLVENLRVGDVRLEEVLPSIEDSGVVEAAVILLARQGKLRLAMDRLISHLSTLELGLVGILQSVRERPGSATTAEAIDDLTGSLDKYAKVGSWLCQAQTKASSRSHAPIINGKRGIAALEEPLSFDETLWLDLIEAIVRIASNVFTFIRGHYEDGELIQVAQSTSHLGSAPSQLVSCFRVLVQQVFNALLASTVRDNGEPGRGRTDVAFLRILRAFLSRAVSWSPSLLELRAVLATVFSAYTYEKSLLSLANGMLDRDLFIHVDEVTRLRQRGWRPRGQSCEICRRRTWGMGVGSKYWEAWEQRQDEERRRRAIRQLEDKFDESVVDGKGKAAVAETSHPMHSNGGGYDEHSRGDATSDDIVRSRADEGPPEPVIVFSCRHVYHRQCLLGVGKTQSGAARKDHHFEPDEGSWEILCPSCR